MNKKIIFINYNKDMNNKIILSKKLNKGYIWQAMFAVIVGCGFSSETPIRSSENEVIAFFNPPYVRFIKLAGPEETESLPGPEEIEPETEPETESLPGPEEIEPETEPETESLAGSEETESYNIITKAKEPNNKLVEEERLAAEERLERAIERAIKIAQARLAAEAETKAQ